MDLTSLLLHKEHALVIVNEKG